MFKVFLGGRFKTEVKLKTLAAAERRYRVVGRALSANS